MIADHDIIGAEYDGTIFIFTALPTIYFRIIICLLTHKPLTDHIEVLRNTFQFKG